MTPNEKQIEYIHEKRGSDFAPIPFSQLRQFTYSTAALHDLVVFLFFAAMHCNTKNCNSGGDKEAEPQKLQIHRSHLLPEQYRKKLPLSEAAPEEELPPSEAAPEEVVSVTTVKLA